MKNELVRHQKYSPQGGYDLAVRLGMARYEYDEYDRVARRGKVVAVTGGLVPMILILAIVLGGGVAQWLLFGLTAVTILSTSILAASNGDAKRGPLYRSQLATRKERQKFGRPIYDYPDEEQFQLLLRIAELEQIGAACQSAEEWEKSWELTVAAYKRYRAVCKARTDSVGRVAAGRNQGRLDEARLSLLADLGRIENELASPDALPELEAAPIAREAGAPSAPKTVYDTLAVILELQPQLDNESLWTQVELIDRDVRALLLRAGQTSGVDVDALATEFYGHLSMIRDVLLRIIDIQANPRYFKNPDELLPQGREAIRAFAEHVVVRIQGIGDADVTDFQVNTDILLAKQYLDC